jgi:hypothetical protein
MALSLEFAERIDENHANLYIELLCKASDIILFSAAIPGQGGHNHVNERWPSYWQALFEENGYEVFDIIRPIIWNDVRVEWRYRQNSFLYINKNREDLVKHFISQDRKVKRIYDVVHPECYMIYRNNMYDPGKRIKALKQWSLRKLYSEHREICDGWIGELQKTMSKR